MGLGNRLLGGGRRSSVRFHVAVGKGDLQTVTTLLERNPVLAVGKNVSDWTPLHAAAARVTGTSQSCCWPTGPTGSVRRLSRVPTLQGDRWSAGVAWMLRRRGSNERRGEADSAVVVWGSPREWEQVPE